MARNNGKYRRIQESFFQTAAGSLAGVLAADDFDCIQSLLLLCIYGSNEPQSVNLWYAIGLALRLAIGMNLHRRETIASEQSLDTEMHKRLFWCVYTMDRSISMSLGLPLGIQDADITMPLPLPLSDEVLANPDRDSQLSFGPDVNDLSTFLHIIELRRINAEIYKSLHSAGDTNLAGTNIDVIRVQHHTRLSRWLVSAPRYLVPASMHQTPEWFQIAYHQAIMNLYRPSHASPVSTINALRHCADSSISLISCYGALYAKNKVTYTFVALTSLFMAGVTMLYSLRASAALRQELTRGVVESNIGSCTTLLHDISHGGAVVERSVEIIERLGRATLAFFESVPGLADNQVDTEFMSWFGLKGHGQHLLDRSPAQPTPSADIPWNDLFECGFDLGNICCGDMLV
ncbi:pyrimidine pathway regulatory protein 1 [Colletotrichum tofieldiae]|nr:pyrimidine pathway regulatory protein 1 [Colletotrichum tofieldiae]GKT72578.1 pyrimidine pathway regulatory protein 1 [Colletotrichum tofieldiae]